MNVFSLRRALIAAMLIATICASIVPIASARPRGRGWDGGRNGGYRGYESYRPYSYRPYTYSPYTYRPYWDDPSYYRSRGGYYYTPRYDRYGAIAYSRTTGEYGYSYNYYNRADAERSALDHCPAADAEVICWARNAYVALAVGDDVEHYGWGWSGNRATAQQRALDECAQRTTNCRIAVTVFTGN